MKFGTIGTSWITASFIEAAREAGNFTLTSVYSRSEEKAIQFTESHKAQHVFTDIEQMAKSTEIDCIYIASPNSLHFEQAILFLKYKKHVICEKPVFSNTKELLQAHKIAKENNVYLFEAVRNIHSPNFDTLKDNINELGQVRSMVLYYAKYSSRYDAYLQGENPNIFSADYSGGALVDLGVYPLYIAINLFGEPRGISYYPVILESGVDGNGTLVLTYDNFICTIICSKISDSCNSCEIQGEQGTLVFEDAGTITGLKRINTKSDKKIQINTLEPEHDMVFEIENFTRIIETKNDQEYKRLKDLSTLVHSIMEAARKQNDIVFKNDD